LWLPKIRDRLKIQAIHEKYVLITGCDTGFGNMLANQLDKQGFHVIAACLTHKGTEEIQANSSSRLKAVLLNVTNQESIKKTVEFIQILVGNQVQRFSMWYLCDSDLSKVTKCMEHALTAKYPRSRYSAGWDAKFFWIPISYAPSCVADYMLRFFLPIPSIHFNSIFCEAL
uniref:Retinol dehydrogenase 7-like n=1 Tax=Callorhinchus milii TaxID=7868 RepID=A0A4W3HTB5_CALMI